MISPDMITIPAASQDLYGKTAGEMASDLFINEEGHVTGTFHHVTGYTGFNSTVPEEQEGYYFPFTIAKKGTKMTFKKNGVESKTNIDWEANNVFRVTASDTFDVIVDGESVVTFSFEGATFAP